MNGNILESVLMNDSERCAARDAAFKAYEAKTLCNHRQKEDGWSAAVATASGSSMTAAEAHQLGLVAFKQKRLWAAEMFWTRSIALRSVGDGINPDTLKARTNRAHVRTILGRRIRSQALGNLVPATALLEGAVADAVAAITIQPDWPVTTLSSTL